MLKIWPETSKMISLSSSTDRPNMGIKSLNLQGYAYPRKSIQRPAMPPATVPFLHTNDSVIFHASANSGNSAIIIIITIILWRKFHTMSKCSSQKNYTDQKSDTIINTTIRIK